MCVWLVRCRLCAAQMMTGKGKRRGNSNEKYKKSDDDRDDDQGKRTEVRQMNDGKTGKLLGEIRAAVPLLLLATDYVRQ